MLAETDTKSPICTNSKQKRQRGAGLILGLLGIMVLLALAAFVIDGGRLFLARLRAQRATDLAAVATAGFIRSGYGDLQASIIGDGILKSNLNESLEKKNKVSASRVRIEPGTSIYPPRVVAEADVEVPFFLAHILGGFTSKILKVSSEAEPPQLAVSLMIDVSSSMCKEVQGDPTITDPAVRAADQQKKCESAPYNERMEDVKEAARSLVTLLDTRLDFLSIGCFGTYKCGTPGFPLKDPMPMKVRHFDRQTAKTAIDSLHALSVYLPWSPTPPMKGPGGTNTEEAIVKMQDEIVKIHSTSNQRDYIRHGRTPPRPLAILLTDGAPTTRAGNYDYVPCIGKNANIPELEEDYKAALAAADKLRKKKVPLYVVGVGGELAGEYEFYKGVDSSPDVYQGAITQMAKDCKVDTPALPYLFGFTLARLADDDRYGYPAPGFKFSGVPGYSSFGLESNTGGKFYYAKNFKHQESALRDIIESYKVALSEIKRR